MSGTLVKEQIARALASVRQALRGKLVRVNAAKRVLLSQVLGVTGETFQDAEMFQHAGFRSVPLSGAEVIVIPLHGKSAHGVVIASSNGALHVANMAEGETAIFNETNGHFIHLKNGSVIRMEADVIELVATTKVSLQTPLVDATGQVRDHAGTMDAMRSIYNGHHHGGSPAPDASM